MYIHTLTANNTQLIPSYLELFHQTLSRVAHEHGTHTLQFAREYYTQEHIHSGLVHEGPQRFSAAFVDHQLRGLLIEENNPLYPIQEIHWLIAAQGTRGLGSKLLEHALNRAYFDKKLGVSLNVSHRSKRARALYEGLGFRPVQHFADGLVDYMHMQKMF